jgi:hypothetical protein
MPFALTPVRRGRPVRLARGLVCAALAVLAAAASAAPGVEPGRRLRLSPEQQREMWERMSPEQREAWRNARSPGESRRAWEGFSPDQRREVWDRLSPEQREMMLRRLPPEQRRDMWRDMSPEQRDAMRHRYIEPRAVEPGAGPPPRPMHHLSPDERQRLRDQIREAQRDFDRQEHRGRGREGGGPR